MFKFKKKSLSHFVIFACLLLFLSFLIPVLRAPSLDILKPPFSLLTVIRREVRGIIFYRRNLAQNERLKKEIDSLRQKLNTLQEIYLENVRLKNLLSFKQKSQFKVIAARVIAHSPDNWSSTIVVDKGSLNRIKPNFAVITHLGLAGKVIETTESTSKIMLINDPNLGVSGIVQRSRQEGLVSGSLGGSLIMKYLPRDADIKTSDVITTSGLSSVYKKGLLIGTVIDVGEEFSGLGRYAIIKPAVDLSNLEEVLIIIP